MKLKPMSIIQNQLQHLYKPQQKATNISAECYYSIAKLDLKLTIVAANYSNAVGACCINIISADQSKSSFDCTSCATSVAEYAPFETACKDNDGKICSAKFTANINPNVLKMEFKLCLPKSNCTRAELTQSYNDGQGTTASVSCGMSGVVIALIVIIVIVAILVVGGVVFFFLKKRSSSTLAY